MDDNDLAVAATEVCKQIWRSEEHRLFDYKGPMAWNEKDRFAIELIKDILAMANSGGGQIVIGVSEPQGGGFSFDGITDSDAKTWDPTRLANKVNSFADPPVSLRVRIAVCYGRKFAVITVDGFLQVPHVCKKECSTPEGSRILTAPTFYVRTANCESSPVRNAADLNELIERAVRTRQGQMLEAMRSIMTGASRTGDVDDRTEFQRQIEEIENGLADPFPDGPYDAYYKDIMFPDIFEEDRFTRNELKEAASKTYVAYGGWAFLEYRDGHEAISSTPDGMKMELRSETERLFGNGNDMYLFWRLRASGLLMVKSLVWEDAHWGPKGQRLIFMNSIVNHCAEAVDALVRLYTQLGVTDENISWECEISGTQGRQLGMPPGGLPLPGPPPVCREAAVKYRKSRSIEDWRAGLVDHATEAARDFLEQFNFRFIDEGHIRRQIREHLHLPA
jgi:hypothetical protein